MKFDYEILKDAICDKNESDGKDVIPRKDIIFENVYEIGGYIMAPYRYLIWREKFSIKIEDYKLRIKQKERSTVINNLLS